MSNYFKVHVQGRQVKIERVLATSGSAETLFCEFDFDESWEGLTKKAVFRNRNVYKTQPLLEDLTCVVPSEVLCESGKLEIGAVGILTYTVDDETYKKVLPTVMVTQPLERGAPDIDNDGEPIPATVLDTILTSVDANTQARHTHQNKSLLDTYTQPNAYLADAVAKKHYHENKTLLDTYTQTETNLADAVSKKHSHVNKTLLDTYTQTEANLADAVTKKHSHPEDFIADIITMDDIINWDEAAEKKHYHPNKDTLDTYTQTEASLADAVSKKHEHTNKTLLDTYTQTETNLADAVSKKHTHGSFSLVEQITGNGTVKVFTRTFTTPYQKLYVYIDMTQYTAMAGHTFSVKFLSGTTELYTRTDNIAAMSSGGYGKYLCEKENGIWRFSRYLLSCAERDASRNIVFDGDMIPVGQTQTLTGLEITETSFFPSGTTIDIWGVEA